MGSFCGSLVLKMKSKALKFILLYLFFTGLVLFYEGGFYYLIQQALSVKLGHSFNQYLVFTQVDGRLRLITSWQAFAQSTILVLLVVLLVRYVSEKYCGLSRQNFSFKIHSFKHEILFNLKLLVYICLGFSLLLVVLKYGFGLSPLMFVDYVNPRSFSYISTPIYAPFIEEVVFRAVVIGLLLKQGVKRNYVIILSAFLFMIAHFLGVATFMPVLHMTGVFLTGLFTAWLYLKFNSLFWPTFWHYFANLTICIAGVYSDYIMSILVKFLV